MELAKLVWHGQHMETTDRYGSCWVDTPSPVGGDIVSMGSLGMQYINPGEEATHYEMPVTGWGDYFGDSVARSNYRSLLEDYPDTFVEVKGGYNSQYLAIPCEALTEELLEIATNLVEQYPLYSDDDHSNLEIEELDEQWYSWIKADILHDLEREYGVDTDDIEGEELLQLFYGWLSDQGSYPYLEDAVTICVPDLDKFVASMARHYGEQS